MFDLEALRASLEVIRVFEELDVPYLVGGSLASSFHGTPRSTNDADLVADLRLANVPLLAAALEAEFYLDRERIRDAVRRRSSFNFIYLATMFKVDVFVLKNDPLAREEMRRRQRVLVDEESGREIDIASPEDTVLQKIAWYRLGECASQRQWDDILGVLKVQRHDLDREYLERWAAHLDVPALLRQAFRDAGVDE